MAQESVGQKVLIPGDAWDPPEKEPFEGEIIRYYRPTRTHPAGRYEVRIPGQGKYLWEVDKFPDSWFIPGDSSAPLPQTPTKPSKSPARSAKSPGRAAKSPGRAKSPARTPRSARMRSINAYAQEPASPTFNLNEANVRMTRSMIKAEKRPEDMEDTAGTYLWPASAPPKQRRRSQRQAEELQLLQQQQQQQEQEAEDGFDATRRQSVASEQEQAEQGPAAFTSKQNLLNGLLLVAVALPSVAYGMYLAYGNCSKVAQHDYPDGLSLWSLQYWCGVGYRRPLLAVNLLFLLNVDMLFYIISLLQGSTWLIDPYWTIIPLLIGWFYQYHPDATTDPWRSLVAMTLLKLWSARLTHSYFRREKYLIGAREDWRYAELREQFGKHWAWVQIFAVYISQHLMLVGITLPLYAVHNSAAPWDPVWDTLATIGCIAGLLTAWVADNQLHAFMTENALRKEQGEETEPVLDTGLWHYSRHPNHFGEQLWWGSLAIFAFRLGQPWMVIGTLFNSLCLIAVMSMVEKRMAQNPARRPHLKHYQATTSFCIPWFKFPAKED